MDYKINLDALAQANIKGISIRGSYQGSEINVSSNESRRNHFVQILFLLLDNFTDKNSVIRWRSFTEDELIQRVKLDKDIYTNPENKFGADFYNNFFQAIPVFLENYCVVSRNNKRKAQEISK